MHFVSIRCEGNPSVKASWGSLGHPLKSACRIALAFACAILPMTQGAFAQSTTSVRDIEVADYRSYLPETHSVRRALHLFAETAQAKSQGQLRIRVLPGTVPGTPMDQIQALREGKEGAPQAMLVAATGLAALQKDFELFDLPYAVQDEKRVDAIVNGEQGREIFSTLPAVGLVGLGWMENGFRQISTAHTQIQAADDLKGMAVRTLPTPTSTAAFDAWGAKAVSIPASKVYESLRAGAVEGQEGFVTQLVQSRLYEVQKHLWLTNHSYGAQILVINADVWQELTPAEQGWLQEAALEASAKQRAWSREEVRQAMSSLESLGMTIHPMAPETIEALANATEILRASN